MVERGARKNGSSHKKEVLKFDQIFPLGENRTFQLVAKIMDMREKPKGALGDLVYERGDSFDYGSGGELNYENPTVYE